MTKKITTLMAVLGLSLIASSAFAAATTWNNSATPGTPVTIAVSTTLIPGATPLVFNPSAQVDLSGGSVRTSFAALTGHAAVMGKDAGQVYGMAADSANVFWLKAPTAYTAITATNSTAFNTTYNRN